MTASGHMVSANGLRFRALVDGPATGTMCILLHGFPEGAESWSAQLTALSSAGVLAVAPDLRGYGLSDAPEGVDSYTLDKLVADIEGLIKAFGRDSAHVAGHDWGGVVAWFFAAQRPAMTRSLTALAVGHPAALAAASRDDEDQHVRSRYIQLFLLEGKAERVLSEDDFRRLRAMFTIGPNPDAVPRSVVNHFVRSMVPPGRLTAALNYYRANLDTSDAPWSRLEKLGPVTAPTHLLWGNQDPALGRRGAEATAEHVSGPYRFEVLEGAGHWLQFERPAAVTQALLDAVSK